MVKCHYSINNYQLALDVDSNYYIAANNISALYFVIEEFEKSLFFAEKAIKIKYDYDLAHLNKGACLYKLTKYSESIISFDKAIEYIKAMFKHM